MKTRRATVGLALTLALVAMLLVSSVVLAAEGVYVVQPGDSLSKIAVKYPGVTWQAICRANQLQNCNLIYVGQRLVIPTGGGSTTEETHWQRLERLDPVFRNQGWQAWLRAAGITWAAIDTEARQIEEETSPAGRILASGLQVKAENMWVPWPNVVTTDVTSRITETNTTRKHQPDLRNASVLYTNVYANGPVTVWVGGSNWGQLWPTTPAPTRDCPTAPADLENWGTVLQWLRDGSGQIAGAQLDGLTADKIQRLKDCGCVVQGDNPSVRSVWLW